MSALLRTKVQPALEAIGLGTYHVGVHPYTGLLGIESQCGKDLVPVGGLNLDKNTVGEVTATAELATDWIYANDDKLMNLVYAKACADKAGKELTEHAAKAYAGTCSAHNFTTGMAPQIRYTSKTADTQTTVTVTWVPKDQKIQTSITHIVTKPGVSTSKPVVKAPGKLSSLLDEAVRTCGLYKKFGDLVSELNACKI